jgi:ABC-type sugar transport system ATPase subunit
MDVREKVSSLDVARQQFVEIAKAMAFRPRVLLLDEPTSALSYEGTESLFGLIRNLRSTNVIIVYITHRLQELKEIADEISVLRDGRLVGQVSADEATPAAIARMMFGGEVKRSAPLQRKMTGKKVLEVSDLNVRDKLHDICFSVEAGEVLGIAGMLGSGRTELLRAVFGADPIDSGSIRIRGVNVRSLSPSETKKHGLGLTPENRKEEGLVQMMSVRDNLCLASLKKVSSNGIIRKRLQDGLVGRTIRELDITVSDPGQRVATLSGGNQQKVVIGKWLSTEPAVIFFDEPTRGIDIQAKQQIFSLIRDLSSRGVGSVFVSTEMEELLEVCHRILVLRKGRVEREFSTEGLKLETLFTECMKE